jgi:agmatinase
MPQQRSALDYVRTGQASFFRLPTLDTASTEPRAVVLGVPWDLGTTHQPGARFAPWAVRQASVTLQAFHPLHRLDVFETLRAVDGGNVVFPPFEPAQVRACIEQHVAAVVRGGARPFVVGGDHSIALPVMRALKAKHGKLAVLHVDAHLDTSSSETWGTEYHHGTPLRHALEEGLIGTFVQVGQRATWVGPEDGALATKHGATLFRVEDVAQRGPRAIAEAIRGLVGHQPVYITFDVDALEPSEVPGTGTPVPGGLTTREALWLLQGLRGIDLVGMDVVEVCPALDVNEQTSLVAAHLLYEGLALAALAAS